MIGFAFFVGLAFLQTEPANADLGALVAAPSDACKDSLDIAIFNAPRRPHVKKPLHFIATTTVAGAADRFQLHVFRDGVAIALTPRAFSGIPSGWVATIATPDVGTWRAILTRNGSPVACQEVIVAKARKGAGRLKVGEDPVWETRIRWERDTENFYSIWIAHMFAGQRSEELSWRRLGDVTRDPARNLLHGHLGLDEDRDHLGLNPDCADFPYTLRAYFAWKMGLPMGFRACRRGNAQRAPTCADDFESNETLTEHADRVQAFRQFFRRLKQVVHSSTPRTAPGDNDSDLYPAALTPAALRPGTVYADPYGHTMVIAGWYPQTDTETGLLMTVDAQPDETVGRRLFWRGNFLFPDDSAVAGAGWKRFRPIRPDRGGLVMWSDQRIARETEDYGDVSDEQWKGGRERFYERMDELVNPRPMAVSMALDAVIEALEQQVVRRVESIDTAEAWFSKHRGKTITMPDGPSIFLTAGPWEDLSTPSRDMRLLIAIDVVQGFPGRVERQPDRFVAGRRHERASLEAELRKRLAARTFSYTRSDGSRQTLALADVIARAPAFEMAWNPNDCAEVRWGAPAGSDEVSRCVRHAPPAQRTRMQAEMRPWFAARQRPLQH